MNYPKKKINEKSKSVQKTIKPPDSAKARRKPMTVTIEPGESDEIAIRAFIDECFAPILAELFISNAKTYHESACERGFVPDMK